MEEDKDDRALSELRDRIREEEDAIQEVRSREEAAKRKTIALQKEIDALRRSREASSRGSEALRERDSRITAVLLEGDQLRQRITTKDEENARMAAEIASLENNTVEVTDALHALKGRQEALIVKVKQLEVAEKQALDGKAAAEDKLRAIGSETRTIEGAIAALEATKKELEALQGSEKEVLQSQEKAIRLSAEQEYNMAIKRASEEEEHLNTDISELRAQLNRLMEGGAWREDRYRKDIWELRRRCEDLEARNEELVAAVPEATRPLLREIEQLQSRSQEKAIQSALHSKERMERIHKMSQRGSDVKDKESAVEAQVGALLSRKVALEQQQQLQRQERERMLAVIRGEETRLSELDVQQTLQMENFQRQRDKLEAEMKRLEEQASIETASLLASVSSTRSIIEELEKKLDKLKHDREEIDSRLSSEIAESRSPSTVSNASNVFPLTAREAGLGARGVDNLSSLQAQLASREASAQALAEEIVGLSTRIEELEREVYDAPTVYDELRILEDRHNALLTYCGEREERILEITQDIQDVKILYKEQLTELMLTLEELQS
uniref:TATA element modulatory factor 1 TATA binding domain-containing protein n=1 Tax=Compsopogon caeruleus TaxID=31354 RepID=A0A7S1XCE8_9RHOD